MLKSENGKKIVSNVPMDKILTESDGPFVQIGTKPSSPLDIENTVNDLALLRKVSKTELQRKIYENFKSILI
jgi:TatD DNase family protein